MRHLPAFVFLFVACANLEPNWCRGSDQLTVASDFEGASVRVLEIDDASRSVSFTPGGDPRRGWPCWWYFRIDGIRPEETITLRLQGSTAALGEQKPLAASWAMPVQATYSTDGKNAIPHDHNRDWSDAPHWNETIAAQRKIGKLIAERRMDVFLDLHNPVPGDPSFFYVLNDELLQAPVIGLRNRFIELAYGRISKIKPLIPMSNKPKVTGKSYHPLWRQISANWVSMNGNPHTVSLCLETVWNYKNSTTTGYEAVGGNLAGATSKYLRERPARN